MYLESFHLVKWSSIHFGIKLRTIRHKVKIHVAEKTMLGWIFIAKWEILHVLLSIIYMSGLLIMRSTHLRSCFRSNRLCHAITLTRWGGLQCFFSNATICAWFKRAIFLFCAVTSAFLLDHDQQTINNDQYLRCRSFFIDKMQLSCSVPFDSKIVIEAIEAIERLLISMFDD